MTSENQANILLVDDRPENLLAMETILADLGQNLVRAASANEALRFLLTEDVALILLDVQMPGLNGFELAELIRERERTQHTPIIFVSATSRDEQYIFKGYSLGAVDYLTKPFQPEILKSKVRFFIKLFLQNQEIKQQALLLEESNSRLDALNTELEKRVMERTAALEASNRELEREVAVRKESEARLTIEHGITRVLADAENLATAAPIILKTFCEVLNADICMLWVLNDEKKNLVSAYAETLDASENVRSFVSESMSSDFASDKALPGRVWEKNTASWMIDDFEEQNCPRTNAANAAGLRTRSRISDTRQGQVPRCH